MFDSSNALLFTDTSNVRDVKVGYIQPNGGQDSQDHCYEVFGM